MEGLTLYQVDAFASQRFAGNPAAVCPLQQWLPDALMQQIAAENNLSETAFFIPHEQGYHIRWFTPTNEVDLCGHATLASAFILVTELGVASEEIQFQSRSGLLRVRVEGERLVLNFPAMVPARVTPPAALVEAFAATTLLSCWANMDYLVVLPDQQSVINSVPDLGLLAKLDRRGVIITAPGEHYDFVCRFFAPAYGIDEDPVTGSAFCQLTPFWAQQLNQFEFNAKQVSARGGEVGCRLLGERVELAGSAVLYMKGTLFL